MSKAGGLRLVPITRSRAQQFVVDHHRHSGPVAAPSSIFQVGLEDEEGTLVGVAIGGVPNARLLCDGRTIEVLRVATLGRRNACSMLYGACCRAAKALGYHSAITYTLEEEDGASLRASGWEREEVGVGGSWDRRGRHTYDQHELFDRGRRPKRTSPRVRWRRRL